MWEIEANLAKVVDLRVALEKMRSDDVTEIAEEKRGMMEMRGGL